MRSKATPLFLLLLTLWAGCDCGGKEMPDVGGSSDVFGLDGSGGDESPLPRGDASSGDASQDGRADSEDNSDSRSDDAFSHPDSHSDVGLGCHQAPCAGRTYRCGDCMDNDGDGLVDDRDPGCLGPCDDTEDVYDIGIGDTATCLVDCYFDQDQGPGNDGCTYNQSCDPLAPAAPRCPYTSDLPPGRSCHRVEDRCGSVCGPLVPNGCDCFGCCEIPGGSGNFVYLGSTPVDGAPPCGPESVHNPMSCRPCTPVRLPGCFNSCERCELCLGRMELPPDCLSSAHPDGGATFDGGSRDATPSSDSWPSPRCPRGEQPCGLPSDPPCPPNGFCVTGC
ncbi:MAG: hypothetical protein RMJ84_10135, partial [Sandaracinaceae bacterium]|nr:hypothetical protein [Sandaracinaceae bacterium]